MTSATVHIVDDDSTMLSGLHCYFEDAGLAVETYGDAEEFLSRYQRSPNCECAVLDVNMPGLSGIALYEKFGERGWTLPVIFLTGHAKVPDAIFALRHGAFDFLQKPFGPEALLSRVNAALDEDRRRRTQSEEATSIATRLGSLTHREHQVAMRVAAGQPNKVIAAELGISPRTVEVYRAKAMSKTGVRSVAELVQLVMRQQAIAS